MGFMMGDLELGSFSIEDSRAQWEGFPLKEGLVPRPKQARKNRKSAEGDNLPPEVLKAMSDQESKGGPEDEPRELTLYEKCQPQRSKLCQKLGRLLASF